MSDTDTYDPFAIDASKPLGHDRNPIVVTASNFEILRVLEGNRLRFGSDDGQTVEIRLATADELIEKTRAAQERMREEMGWGPDEGPDGMSRTHAENLATPIDIEQILARR